MAGNYADIDNLEAIVSFFNRSEPVTDSARKIKDAFANWYGNLGWYDKHMDTENAVNHAMNSRDEFNRANATTAAEREQVERVIKTGLKTEQVLGLPEKARTSSGALHEDVPPLIPTPYKIAAAAAAGVAIVAIAAKKLHLI